MKKGVLEVAKRLNGDIGIENFWENNGSPDFLEIMAQTMKELEKGLDMYGVYLTDTMLGENGTRYEYEAPGDKMLNYDLDFNEMMIEEYLLERVLRKHGFDKAADFYERRWDEALEEL